jgi:amino acid adenylation domain-containing protein
VAIGHGALGNFLDSMADRPGLSAGDALLAVTSPSFDIAGLELFLPLLAGARIELASREETMDGRRLRRRLAESGATLMQATPATWRLLIDAGWPGAGGGEPVRVLVGGEALPDRLAAELCARSEAVWNLYGPTEMTIWSALARVDPSVSTIGRPIAATRLAIADGGGEPVPVGVPAELRIGGEGVARGYLGRPELTAERFVPDPLGGAAPGARAYRTGDLARWRPDGSIEFLGRIDTQVKVRGFRIELGEVEAALSALPGVAQAVASVRGEGAARILVGYLVAASAASSEPAAASPAADLRASLARTLPEPMIPTAFVHLAALPLTPNGKVDRGALPAPDFDRAARAFASPRDAVEEVLAAVWAEVLGLERVSIDEDFFALGGHSLLATRVVARVRGALGVDLPVRALFEHPTIAALARVVDGERAAVGWTAAPPLSKQFRGGTTSGLPVSFAQARLWFLHQLEPASPVYHLPLALRLAGALDLPALAGALSEIARRHEALRTRFPVEDGEPTQEIVPIDLFAARSLPLADLSALPPGLRAAEARRRAVAEAVRPFDLAAGPVSRATLLRLAPEEHVGLLTQHHIVSDAWSLGVLLAELSALYAAAREGRPSPLPELPIQYADFTLWQRAWLSGEVLERQLDYWRRQLGEVPHTLDLPADRPRPPQQSFRGAARAVRLAPELVRELRAIARKESATPFMVGLALFQALLCRWTGRREVLVGSPVANRERVEVEGLIGFFANTLALRGGLGGIHLRASLAAARETVLEATAHQDLPFEKLVEELKPERDPSRSPLVQVLYTLQPQNPTTALSGLAASPFAGGAAAAKFDLTLSLIDAPAGPQGIAGALEFSTALFDPASAARMVGQIEALFAAAVADPEAALDALPLLAAPERHQLAVEWNDPPGPDAGELLLDELFFRQAERTPERPAVESAEGIWSYAELAARARRISGDLARLGLVPGDRVGLAADRSLDQVAGLLGILHAGAAYVPIDPEYPAERRRFMLADARVRAVLGGEASRAELAQALGDGVAWLSLDGASAAENETTAERAAVPASAPAYVIYTSGSTGRPKGVVVPHRAIVNRVVWMAEAHPLEADDKVLYKTPLAFDASIWEIFLPLSAGARVVLARPGGHRDSGYLVGAVIEHGVTVLQLVPSMLQAFLEEPEVASCTTLRRLFAGGEALSVETVRRASVLLPGAPLTNLYGPTEAAIDVASNPRVGLSAAFHLRASGKANVPLGRPLSRVRLTIVEPLRELDGEPAGIGTPGELRISGVHLALGYFGRPDLTAERFVPAQGGEPGARAYRTGDLARWLPDGEIEYLGRIDGQVKVRGVRVEIGEIEAVLARHPAVARAAVALRGGGRWLAGFWVRKSGASAAPEELAAFLSARLPDAMVPALLVELPALPTLPNGKLDRAALPEPTLAGAADGVGGVAPRTPSEQILAAIWAEVLGRSESPEGVEASPSSGVIGASDDFFALGGHSLLATRVVARVRGALGVDLPVRALFEHPTIAALARVVDGARAAADWSAAPPLSTEARGGRGERGDWDGAMSGLPVSFAQARLWFLHQLEPESPVYHLPLALRLEGNLDLPALAGALREIARRHEALRTRFPVEDGEPTQTIVPIELFATGSLPLADLSALPPAPRMAEARRQAMAEAVRPFDLAAGPVSRSALLRLTEEEHVGLLTQHHIVSDAWSRGVLLAELSALYAAAREGRPSPLPELPIQYADFALWQRAWLSGEVLERQLDYWRRELGDVPHALDLPTDRPRPPQQSFRGATRAVGLAPALARDLRAFARKESATPYMVGLALFQALLCRWTGRSEVLVGSPVANRERVEIEGLIGFFANTLVLRGGLASGAAGDLRSRLKAARETVLEATAHQDLPFEKLVEELKPERDPSRSPLIQVLYTLQPQAAPVLALPGLSASPLTGAAATTAKFDLTLSLVDASAGAQGIAGGLEFSTALFDPATAARMAGQIEALFAAAVADPAADLESLPLLSAPERHQLRVEWNDADLALPPLVLHDFLVRHAAERPDDPALESEHEPGRRHTWGEVAARAELLARRLAGLGAGPERVVGVSLEWSVDRALAMLAIWRAGACYLPVDPDLPAERRALLLSESNAVVLIARERSWPDLFPADAVAAESFAFAPLLLGDDGLPAAPGAEATPSSALPENLAYLIYTSGSTGTPKGVAIGHRDAAGHFAAAAGFYGWRADDRVIQLGSMSFDLAVDQVGMALAAGATLVVRGPELPPPMDLSAWLAKLRITCATLPTPLWSEWTLATEPLPPDLRMVYAGGEAMTSTAAARFRTRLGAAQAAGKTPPRVWNAYGPTEAVVAATCHDFGQGRLPNSGSVSIGRLLPRRVAYVIDGQGALQPLGGHGELALGGLIARGYLGRPDLTAERFRPDPSGLPGARVYWTGDRVRRRGDGSFDYLGRIDHQVKIRGFRIEPGEIEAALSAHPQVGEAIVLARETVGAGPRLIAWYRPLAPVGGDAALAPDLRRFLAGRLPDYMVPGAFVEVAEWPLNQSGKVDRRALPAPDLDSAARAFSPPRDAVEEVLAGVWAEVLGLERVGVDEDFFDLGGHSLLATRVVSRIHKVFRMELPLRDFFGGTTVAGLAGIVREREARPGRAEKIARLYLSIERLPEEGVRDQLAARREQDEKLAAAGAASPANIADGRDE